MSDKEIKMLFLMLFGWPLLAAIIGVTIMKVINRIFNRIFNTNIEFMNVGDSFIAKGIHMIMFVGSLVLAFPILRWIERLL